MIKIATIVTIAITNGRAKSKAGMKSHATKYQYEYIGIMIDMPPKQKHVYVLTGSFAG